MSTMAAISALSTAVILVVAVIQTVNRDPMAVHLLQAAAIFWIASILSMQAAWVRDHSHEE